MNDDLALPPFLKRPDLTLEQQRAELARMNTRAVKARERLLSPAEAPLSPAAQARIEREKEAARVRIEKLVAKKRGLASQLPASGRDAERMLAMAAKRGKKEQALREQRADDALQVVETTLADAPSAEDVPFDRPAAEPPASAEAEAPAPPAEADALVQPVPEGEPPADTQQESSVRTTTKSKSKAARKAAGKKAAKSPAKSAAKPGNGHSKVELIASLLKRRQGCTAAEVLEATGWPTVSMPQQAKAAGLKLKKEKDGRVLRYRAV